MLLEHLKPVHVDLRGTIVDLLQGVPVEHATMITSTAGALRGNHYHKRTTQYVVLLSGRLQAYAKEPRGEVTSRQVEPLDLIVNRPFERHALVALEDSTFLVLTHGPRGGRNYEKDTYRV